LHNEGPFGLPSLLAKEGYTVTPLMKRAPIAKSQQVRDLVLGRDRFFFNPENKNHQAAENKDSAIVVFSPHKR